MQQPESKLPKINFKKINKNMITNNWKGTGKAIRDDLVSNGGFSKFYKAKRMRMQVNNPNSMFLETHLHTTLQAQGVTNSISNT